MLIEVVYRLLCGDIEADMYLGVSAGKHRYVCLLVHGQQIGKLLKSSLELTVLLPQYASATPGKIIQQEDKFELIWVGQIMR